VNEEGQGPTRGLSRREKRKQYLYVWVEVGGDRESKKKLNYKIVISSISNRGRDTVCSELLKTLILYVVACILHTMEASIT